MFILGINHKTAPIEIREKFFLTPVEQDLLLSELKSNPAVIEAFVLSTCNRTEVYANVLEGHNVFPAIIRILTGIKKIPFGKDTSSHFYTYAGREAVRHLLQVVTGLDSLVLGEKQILGQVKASLERAQEKGFFTRTFNILANVAVRAGKKAQNETEISYGGSSVGWAAIVMAEQLLRTLEGRSVLIIGAGKMSETVLNQLPSKGIQEIFLMNRTQCNAETLASKYQGTPVSFCDIKEVLSRVDIAICSVGAPHHILEKETVEKIMALREGRRLVLIDISMPRNIDPQVAEVPNVHLSFLDDLQAVVGETMRKRQAAVTQVTEIIESKLAEFYLKIEKAGSYDDGAPADSPDNPRASRPDTHRTL